MVDGCLTRYGPCDKMLLTGPACVRDRRRFASFSGKTTSGYAGEGKIESKS